MPSAKKLKIEGFGMACSTHSTVRQIQSAADLEHSLQDSREKGIPICLRGSGASYGDAALTTNHNLFDLRGMNKILNWDPEKGTLRAQAGVTISQIWRATIEDGYWPFVVSGTMVPTLGGAISMNIHGKNCWSTGPIGDYVLSLKLLQPDGTTIECSRESKGEIFHAVIGGFGMLGCITEVELQLKRIYSGLVEVRAHCTPSLRALFERFEESLARSEYVVGWIDGFAKSEKLGRSLVHEARYLKEEEDKEPSTSLSVQAQTLSPRIFGVFPKKWMWLLMWPFANRVGMCFVNAVKYYLSRIFDRGKPYLQSLVAFNFLLDYVPNWKKIYLPGGFIQHQSFVPLENAYETIKAILEITHRHQMPPFLAVFKRHRPDSFLMSHGVDGYSLALDFPITASTRGKILLMTDEIDTLVCSVGGRFYPAKDATLRGDTYRKSLPEEAIREFLELKTKVDPDGLMKTDLSDRLLHDGPHNPGIL